MAEEGESTEVTVLSYAVEAEEDGAERLLSDLRNSFPDAVVQLARPWRDPNAAAIELIASQTAQAREDGSLLAKRPEIDLLLRLAGTTQISVALERAGYRGGRSRKGEKGGLVLVAIGRGEEMERLRGRASSMGQLRPLRRRHLGDRDLGRVERAALLNAERA